MKKSTPSKPPKLNKKAKKDAASAAWEERLRKSEEEDAIKRPRGLCEKCARAKATRRVVKSAQRGTALERIITYLHLCDRCYQAHPILGPDRGISAPPPSSPSHGGARGSVHIVNTGRSRKPGYHKS